MEANRPAVGLVVVHSLNPAGRANMLALLRSAGYETLECPFFRLVAELPNILAQEPAT
jgi:uroporphyrinogen-III synthase